MDAVIGQKIVNLYNKGYTIRQIAQSGNIPYKREQVRKELKSAGVPLRGRATTYPHYLSFTVDEQALLAELLGYLYGDGSVHKNKNTRSGLYDCNLAFSIDEEDLVICVSSIIKSLFGYRPTIRKKKDIYLIKFRRSVAKYIHSIGYPAGKKSVLNPKLPKHILSTCETQQSFIRGFLNAEASINKSVFVHQSVRLAISEKNVKSLKAKGKICLIKGHRRYFVRWSDAKQVLNSHKLPKSNILLGIQYLLKQADISSTVYPIRVYIGKNTALHYELWVSKRDLRKVMEHRLLTSKKKFHVLSTLLREWQSGQMRKLQELVP